MQFETDPYGFGMDLPPLGGDIPGDPPPSIPDDFSSALGVIKGNTWRTAFPEDRRASVDSAFAMIVKEAEKDVAKKVSYGGREIPLRHKTGEWTIQGKEWLQQQRGLLQAAAEDEKGGTEHDPYTGEIEVAPHLTGFLGKPKKQRDPLSKYGDIKNEVESEVIDGKPRELTWETFVERANEGVDPDSPAAIDPDNVAMKALFESRKKIDSFDPESMGDKPMEIVEGIPIFNPKMMHRPSVLENAIKESSLSPADKKMAMIGLRDAYVRLDTSVITNQSEALDAEMHKAPFLMAADLVGIERNTLTKRFFDHMAKIDGTGSIYSFIKENEAEFSDDKFGWADKLSNAFWNASRSTGVGALWLLDKITPSPSSKDGKPGSMESFVSQLASDSARANDSAFRGMGDIEHYRVLGMDFTNKGFYDMAGQVMSILATAGGGALLKGGLKMAGTTAVGGQLAPKAGIAGVMAKGIMASDDAILAATKSLAPNTAKNLVIKALRDPSAYIGGLQASGMSFGTTFNEVMDQTGNHAEALKKANIQAISDGLSAFVATSVFNRIAPGAEKMLTGVEGSMGGSILSRMKYAKASAASKTKQEVLDLVKDMTEDEALRKALSKGLAETVDRGARAAGLKGFGAAAGMTSEFFEESVDTALSDVFSAILDDSKTWTDSVWNNIGEKFSEYMAAGVMGAFGGGLGETVGGVSSFSKASREKRAADVKFYADRVWENIKGNVESFDPNVHQAAAQAGVDKQIVSWAEYLANSPDSNDVKAKKFADEMLAGAYTGDYTSAPIEEREETPAGASTADEPPSAGPSATGAATDDSGAAEDEGTAILKEAGIQPTGNRVLTPGLAVVRGEPIKVGKMGTMVPVMVGKASSPVAVEWTLSGGKTERISPEKAASILEENKGLFGPFKFGVNRTIKEFREAKSQYDQHTNYVWTTEQSTASDDDSGQEPAPREEDSRDSEKPEAGRGEEPASLSGPESARQPASSAPAQPALTPSGNEKFDKAFPVERVSFDEESHTYSVDGENLPSVTTKLSSHKAFSFDGPKDAGKAARDLGTAYHKKIEKELAGEKTDLHPELKRIIGQIKKRAKGPIVSEKIVFTKGYAGTVDVLVQLDDGTFELIDFKTSKAEKRADYDKPFKKGKESKAMSHQVQLKAYVEALKASGIEVSKTTIVHIPTNGAAYSQDVQISPEAEAYYEEIFGKAEKRDAPLATAKTEQPTTNDNGTLEENEGQGLQAQGQVTVSLKNGDTFKIEPGKSSTGRDVFFVYDSTSKYRAQVNSMEDAMSSIRTSARARRTEISDGSPPLAEQPAVEPEEAAEDTTSAPPKVELPGETPGVKAEMRKLQAFTEDVWRGVIEAGRDANPDRFDAARLLIAKRTGVDPLASAVLDAATPTAAKKPSPKAEIVTFTAKKSMVTNGTDSLGGTWTAVKSSGKDGPETFLYTPPKGQTMRGNPSVLSLIGDNNEDTGEVLVLTGILNGRYQFKKIDLNQALENQSLGLEQTNFDRASRQWESTRLTAANKVVVQSLAKLLGSGTVSQKDFDKVFNAVLKLVAPNVDPRDVVFTKLPGDSFIRTEAREQIVVDTDKPIGGAPFKMENQPPATVSTKVEERPVVVVDKDKMVGHFRYIFDGYRQGRGEFYDTMTANELARQLATWIDEEQIHRIALPLFTQEELQQFFNEALAAEGDAKSIRNMLLETAEERLGKDFKTEDATPEQVRMLVHETLRKMHQLISTGSHSEMQTDSAKAVMAILNEEAGRKGVFDKMKTVVAMMRRYFQRVKNALYMRRLHRKMTGHQQNMLNRLMSAYSKANLQGDVDMISQKATDHAAWVYGEWKKDFEERTNKLIMESDLSDALTELKGLPKRFPSAHLTDMVLLDPKTGALSLSDSVKRLAKNGYLNASIEDMEKALNTLNENETGLGAMQQLVLARQAMEAALFNVDDVRGLSVSDPTSTEVWNALAEGVRMSGDINALAAIQNFFANERRKVQAELADTLESLDADVLQEVRDADVESRAGMDKLLDIATKVGFPTDRMSEDHTFLSAYPAGDGLVEWAARFGIDPGESAANPRAGWRLHLLASLAIKMNSQLAGDSGKQGVLAELVNPLAVAKARKNAESKLAAISQRMAEQEQAYQESQNDAIKPKPLDEQTQDKYIRYTAFLQAVDEYNKAARNVVQRAVGEFDYRNAEHGLTFLDVSNPLAIPAPTYGFFDVDRFSVDQVNGYRYITASESAAMDDKQRAELFGGYHRPSRTRSPELYSIVSSNAGHQGKVMFERFHLLQSRGVVPMSDTYTLTGGFNIPVEVSQDGGSRTPHPEQIFYRWKADAGLDIHRQYVTGYGRDKTYPSTEKVIEAIGMDRDLEAKTNTYMDHLDYTEKWLDDMDFLVAEGAVVEEIGGVQTLAGRQAVLLRRRLAEARAAYDAHRDQITALHNKAKAGLPNIGQEFDSLMSGLNDKTKVFREAMWNASADVMMARTAFRAFTDPQWRSNVRQEANRSTRDAGFKPNEEYLALRDRPIDLPTYVNYSWYLDFLSQKSSQYFVSPVFGTDLLRDLEKGNWSNDGFEVFRTSVNESFRKYRRAKAPSGATIYEKADEQTAKDITSRYLWSLGETHEERISSYQKGLADSGSEFGVVMLTVGSYAVIDRDGVVHIPRTETDEAGNFQYDVQTRTVADDYVFAQNQRDADGRPLLPPTTMETSPYEEEETQARAARKKDAPDMIRRRWFTKTALLVGMRIRNPKTREVGMRDTQEAQRFFHDISSLGDGSNVNDVVRRGIAGLFGLYDYSFSPSEGDILGRLVGEFLSRYAIQSNDPISLLENMVMFKAEKEQALLDQARVKDPDLAMQALVTLVAEATAGGRNQDMRGVSARPKMDKGAYAEEEVLGRPYTQEVEETYEETVPDPEGPFGGETKTVRKTRKKELVTGRAAPEGEFDGLDKAYREKNGGRSLFTPELKIPQRILDIKDDAERRKAIREFSKDLLPNEFVSEDEIAEITRQFRRDMLATAGEIPAFRASVLKQDGGEHPFVSSNRTVNLLLQSLLGDVVIYAPRRGVVVNGREVKTRVIPGRNGGPTVLYVRPGAQTSRDEAAALIASALSIHAANNPAIEQAIKDFAKDGMEKIGVMRMVDRIDRIAEHRAKLYHYLAKRLGDKMLRGQKVESHLRASMQVALRDHLIRMARHAANRGSLNEASLYDENGQQTINGSIIFVSELMTNPKIKELYDYLTAEDGLTSIPDTGISPEALMEILQSVEDVTRSEFSDQDNQAAQYENDGLEDADLDYNEEDALQEGDSPELFDDNLGLELQEAADADPDVTGVMAQALANLGKDAGEAEFDPLAPAKAAKTGLVESKRRIDGLLRRAFRDKSIHLKPSKTLAMLISESRNMGNTGLHRGDAEIISFFAKLLGEANRRVAPFEGREATDYRYDTRESRLKAMKAMAGDEAYGKALASAVLPGTNYGGKYYGGNWATLLRPDNPSRSSLITTAMNTNRHHTMVAGLLGETFIVDSAMMEMLRQREEEIALSKIGATKEKPGLSGYGQQDVFVQATDSLMSQLGDVLPRGEWQEVDGVTINRVQLAARERKRVIEAVFVRKKESEQRLQKAKAEREKLEAGLDKDDVSLEEIKAEDNEPLVSEVVEHLVESLDDAIRYRSFNRIDRRVAHDFRRLTRGTAWKTRVSEVGDSLVAVANASKANEKAKNSSSTRIALAFAVANANGVISRFEDDANALLDDILREQYGVRFAMKDGVRQKALRIERVDKYGDNRELVALNIDGVFRPDALARRIGSTMSLLERGEMGDVFSDVLVGGVQAAEERFSGNKEKAIRAAKGKATKPRKGDLTTNSQKQLNNLIRDLEQRFGDNPDRSEARAYIRSIVERGFSQEESLNLPSDIVEDNKLLSSAVRALIPSKEFRMRMLTDTGKLSVEVRDSIEKAKQTELDAQREIEQADAEIARLVARSALTQEVGWTKRFSEDPDATDENGQRPEMSFIIHLAPPGLEVSPSMTPMERNRAIREFSQKRSAEMLAQLERGEMPDFSYIANVDAIMREVGHVARHELDETYKLLKADSQYFNDFNPQLLIQNTVEQAKAEKAMIEARIKQARDIADGVRPTGGLNSLGIDALTMLSDPANGVNIMSVNAKKRVSTWTAPANWQARRDLLGRLVNDEGQWVVLAPTTAREELAKRYADTGRPKVTFENFVLDAMAPTLTGKDYEGNSVSRLNFSSDYLDEPTELDLPVIVNGKKVSTKGMSRREAAKVIEHEYRVRTLLRLQADANKNGDRKIEDSGAVAEALDRFSYMVRAMVHAHNHKLLATDVKAKLDDWIRRLQDMSQNDNHFTDLSTVQEMNTIEMFADVFADIEGGYIMDTLASGLAMDPQAHTLAMMKYLHHEDGRTRGRFIRSYVAMQEAMRIRSLLDRGFDDTSGRIGAKVQHEEAKRKILKTQKALGDDALDQSRAYVHASLQGLLETRSGTVSGNLKRWMDDFEKGVYDLEELDKQQNKKFKNAGSRFFRAMHIDLIRDIEMVREIKRSIQKELDAFAKSNDLTFESRELMATKLIASMQSKLAVGAKQSEIKAHSDTLVGVFNGLTDAMAVTKMLMSQPETTPVAESEYNPLYNKSKNPKVFFNTTVPLRFHYASNPMESEVDKASFEEGKRIQDPIEIVKLEESSLFGGVGRHEALKGRAPYRPVNLNGLSAVDSLLEDAFYRLNVTPAYTVLRKVVGREEPTKSGITMISEDAKILKPINQTKDWKYEHRAKRVALAAVARELENVIANDSQMGTYNTQFAEAIRFLSSMFTVKALFSVLQLWNQTAPASVMMAVKKLLVGDVRGAKEFLKIAARMGGSGTLARMKGFAQSEAEKNNSDAFFNRVDKWVKTVDPWISFRGTDGMDPYRNVLRNQKRYGVGAVKATVGKMTKQLEALGEKGLDTTIGVGERWIARSIYMTELLGELRRMKDAGVIDYAPENVDRLLEIPGNLIPTQAKDYARMKVNDMMGMADQSKKALLFQSHSRFPGIQALTRSAVRFSNHTATTASNMTALLPAIGRLSDNASYGEQRMRVEAVENLIGTLGQNTLFHLMKLHTLVPLVAYIIFNSTGDDDDEAQEKAQALADGMLAPSEEMDKVSDYLKAAVFGKENQLFQDWRDPESARKSAYANLLGKTMTEFAQAIPVAGVALGYMPVNAASKNLTDPIAEHLLAIGEDMEVARGNMAEDGVKIYERERGPIEGIAQLTAPSAELYNLFDAGRTAAKSMFLDEPDGMTTAAYLLSEVFATRELRGALEGRLKQKIRDEE